MENDIAIAEALNGSFEILIEQHYDANVSYGLSEELIAGAFPENEQLTYEYVSPVNQVLSDNRSRIPEIDSGDSDDSESSGNEVELANPLIQSFVDNRVDNIIAEIVESAETTTFFERDKDKIRAKTDKTFRSVAFDLESVLYTPFGKSCNLFYTRKLAYYNLTFYELDTKEVYCYVWSEVDAKRGANDVGSCILEYLSKLPPEVREVSFYSDTCAGQNRNQYIMAMFLHAIQTLNIDVITHNFMESGHNELEVDSVHSAIEAYRRNRSVFSLDQWKSIITLAREDQPYQVIDMSFDSFSDFKKISSLLVNNTKTDVNGQKFRMSEVKRLRYRISDPNIVEFSYDYSPHFSELNVSGRRGRRRKEAVYVLPQAYFNLQPISEPKKKDLVHMCDTGVIPAGYAQFYRDLPTAINVVDRLAEPDDLEDDFLITE